VNEFTGKVIGRKISDVRRRAKYIVMPLEDDGFLITHLRMTGRLAIHSKDEPADKHHHAIFLLEDGRELRLHDTRKFGRIRYTTQPDTVLGRLGPEPLDEYFTPEAFSQRILARRRQLKPLLLDQEFIAGIGNIYADEALWTARLHPRRNSDSLSAEEAATLLDAIRTVLQSALGNQGTSLGAGETNYAYGSGKRGRNSGSLNIFRRTGEPCPRCGTSIERMTVGQRSTHICPSCQKER
jgi:formamidopyrimidine-DNA glycosylase